MAHTLSDPQDERTDTQRGLTFLDLPPEIILHVLSYLDLPDHVALASTSEHLGRLSMDPALHRNRLRIVTPARVNHFLSSSCRSLFIELIDRGIARGLDLARRWRQGAYIYSPESVRQYQIYNTHRLRILRRSLSAALSSSKMQVSVKRPLRPFTNKIGDHEVSQNPLVSLHILRILPDIEAVSLRISRSLLPAVLKLKHSIRRDELKRSLTAHHYALEKTNNVDNNRVNWLVNGSGRGMWFENERTRLAICPGIRSVINHFESLNPNISI